MVGLPPAVATSKKIATAVNMAITMTLVLMIATVATYPLYYYVLLPLDLVYLQTISFVFLTALGIKTAEACLKRFKPELYQRVAVFIPLTLINSAVLGVALVNMQSQHGVIGSVFFGLGAAIGFGLVIIAMAAMQERMMAAEIPTPFRGIAILLITLGIMSMAFMGFNGIASL